MSQACRLTIEDEQLLLITIQDQQRRLFLSCVDKRRKLDEKKAAARLKTTSSTGITGSTTEVAVTEAVVDYECNGIVVGGRRLGIMYRNTKDRQDKFDDVMGPMPGDVVTPSHSHTRH